MSTEENRAIATRFYYALAKADIDTIKALQVPDVAYNIVGSIPISGRVVGVDQVYDVTVADVFSRLKPESVSFARKWKIMCADEDRVVCLMMGGGIGQNGADYSQTYCHIFTIRDGKIVEVHEFFDTALAEVALYDNPLATPRTPPANAFEF